MKQPSAMKLGLLLSMSMSWTADAFTMTPITHPRATAASHDQSIGDRPHSALHFFPGVIPSTAYTPRMSETEENAVFFFNKAREFAYCDDNNDNNDHKRAASYLRQILYIQSRCAAGTLAGERVCAIDHDLVDLVARLRIKAGSAYHVNDEEAHYYATDSWQFS